MTDASEPTPSMPPRRAFLIKGAALTGASMAGLAGLSARGETPVDSLNTSRTTQGAASAMAADTSDRRKRGLDAINRLTGATGEQVIESLQDIAPDLGDWIIDFAYGDVFSRPQLDLRSRQFATIAALTAMGTATPQLKVHIHGGLNVGCTPQEIIEVMLQMAVYAGFPAAINGIIAAREVFEERGQMP